MHTRPPDANGAPNVSEKFHGVVANPVAFWGQRPRFESWWDYVLGFSNPHSHESSCSRWSHTDCSLIRGHVHRVTAVVDSVSEPGEPRETGFLATPVPDCDTVILAVHHLSVGP